MTADPRFLAEVTRLLFEGDLAGAREIARYMAEDEIPGHERAALLVQAAATRAGQNPS